MKYIKLMMPAVLFLLAAVFLFQKECGKSEFRDHNLILISLDTTRADHIDTGKGARSYTPDLRKFSLGSTVFNNAFSVSNQTLPSHMSVFTSLYPHQIGIRSNEAVYEGKPKMLQEILKGAGYHTSAVISLGTLSSKTGFSRGFDDFDESLFQEKIFFVSADKVTDRAIQKLNEKDREKFFLFLHYSDPHSPYSPPDVSGRIEIRLDGEKIAGVNAYTGAILKLNVELTKGKHRIEFINLDDTDDFSFFALRHIKFGKKDIVSVRGAEFDPALYGGAYAMRGNSAEFSVESGKDSRFRIFQVIPVLTKPAALRLYSSEVEFMDRQLGKLFEYIERSGLKKKTLIFIFGDHGEGLGERDKYVGHVKYLNRQFIHVPLIVHLPGNKHRVIDAPVSLISVTPTVLDLLDIETEGIAGRQTFFKGVDDPSEKVIVRSEAFFPTAVSNIYSIINDPFQCIYFFKETEFQRNEFYNYRNSSSFSFDDRIFEGVFRRTFPAKYSFFLQNIREASKVFPERTVDPYIPTPAEREKLESLGYLNK